MTTRAGARYAGYRCAASKVSHRSVQAAWNRKFADSPLERNGFERSVPRGDGLRPRPRRLPACLARCLGGDCLDGTPLIDL